MKNFWLRNSTISNEELEIAVLNYNSKSVSLGSHNGSWSAYLDADSVLRRSLEKLTRMILNDLDIDSSKFKRVRSVIEDVSRIAFKEVVKFSVLREKAIDFFSTIIKKELLFRYRLIK